MKPKLYLHIGDHKTGTSAIQEFCRSNYNLLFKNGIFYPYISKYPLNNFNEDAYEPLKKKIKNHHSMFHSLSLHNKYWLDIINQKYLKKIFYQKKVLSSKKLLSKNEICEILESFQNVCLISNKDLLLSSEQINRHKISTNLKLPSRIQYYKYLKEILEDYFEVEIIFILRKHIFFVQSLYYELVANGYAKENFYVEDLIKEQSWRFNYLERLNELNKVFEKISVFSYDNLLKENGIVENFIKKCLRKNINFQQESTFKPSQKIRESLSAAECTLKLKLNYENGIRISPKKNKLLITWIKSNYVQKILNRVFNKDNLGLWSFGQTSIDKYEKLFLKESNKLKKLYDLDFKKNLKRLIQDEFIGYINKEQLKELSNDKKLSEKEFSFIKKILESKINAPNKF